MDKFIATLGSAVPRTSAGLLVRGNATDPAAGSSQAAAGIPSGTDADAVAAEHDTGRPAMLLSADIQQLLGIEAEPLSAQAGEHRQARAAQDSSRPSGAVADGADLLARRMAQARQWLSTPDMQERLRQRGLAPDEVESQLQRQAASVMRMLGSAAGQGGAVFPLVPSAHELFGRAVLEADQIQRDTAAGLPDPGGALAAPSPTTTAIAIPDIAVAEPHVDLVRRDGALRALEGFERHYVTSLPQIGWRRLQPLWHFVQGDIYFLTQDHAAAVFPCAANMTGGAAGVPLSATYPQHAAERSSVRRAFVRDQPVVVARSPNSGSVRISTDGYTWRTTPFYTDAVVEAAKLETWRRVMTFGNEVYRRVLENSLWK